MRVSNQICHTKYKIAHFFLIKKILALLYITWIPFGQV